MFIEGGTIVDATSVAPRSNVSIDNGEEIFEMAKIVAQAGGYYGTHVGSEGYQLVEEVGKAIQVAAVARIPVHIYHFKIRGRNLWGQVEPAIDLIQAARGRGLEITANQYPYTAMSHPWGALFPSWARSGPPGQIVELLKDKATREKLKQDAVFKQYVEEHGGWEGSVGSSFKNPALKPLDGKTIAEIAKIRNPKGTRSAERLAERAEGAITTRLSGEAGKPASPRCC